MDVSLTPVEVRVVGALAEKALATPDHYPMSLNALTAACNQKTGREPVMALSEDEVMEALDALMRKKLAGNTSGAGARVEKYRHTLDRRFDLGGAALAALTVLLLRGPQTAGEVRARTARLHPFETLEDVEVTLRGLVEREEPLATELPLQPGRKEPRFAHLLGGPVAEDALGPAPTAGGERVAALERRVEALEEALDALREAFERFRNQFE
jgi:uncharacterized protein YceH (UPF0502 family)